MSANTRQVHAEDRIETDFREYTISHTTDAASTSYTEGETSYEVRAVDRYEGIRIQIREGGNLERITRVEEPMPESGERLRELAEEHLDA